MSEVALAAEVRRAQGSANSRRLRSAGKIPGVVYGHGVEPTAVAVDARSFRAAMHTDAGANALITLDVEGTKHLALARDIQKHPVRNTVAHVDFQVVNRDESITAEVPLNFVGEALGVTKNGGIVEHLLTTILVTATPTTIPAHIDVDISTLQLEETLRIKDITLPAGVVATLDPEEGVVVGSPTRGAASAGGAGTTEEAVEG